MAKKKTEEMAMPTPVGTPAKAGEFDEYQVKGAAEDIARAHEHMQNKKLMKHVRKHLATKAKAVNAMMSALPADDGDGDEELTDTKSLRNTFNKKFGAK